MTDRRRTLLAVLFALLLPSSGCARLLHHYDVTPDGLARSDARLRDALAAGDNSAAIAKLIGERDALPSDPLLASLYTGVLAYHAGDYATSAATLDAATLLIDERMTQSVSRNALSILSSDRVLPYQPGTTERAMLHYYAALAWLRDGSVEGAAVEARRLSALLESAPPADGDQREVHAALRHFTAAVYAMAGERNDADVAYRNALLLAGDSAQGERMPLPNGDSIDVIVFIDRGFVGHRAEQSVALWLGTDEVHGLRSGNDDHRLHLAQLVASRIAATSETSGTAFGTLRVDAAQEAAAPSAQPEAKQPTAFLTSAGEATAADPAHDDDDSDDEDDDTPYLMRIAWPIFRDAAPAIGRTTLVVDSTTIAPTQHASVSRSVARDFSADRGWMVARTVARAAAKLAVTRGIEGELREKDETAADLFALLGNATAAVTEQADTRSWTLLPGAIELVRVRLPAGAHSVFVQSAGRRVPIEIAADAGGIVLRHVSLH